MAEKKVSSAEVKQLFKVVPRAESKAIRQCGVHWIGNNMRDILIT